MRIPSGSSLQRIALCLAAAAGFTVACSKDSTTGLRAGPPAQLSIVSGDGQSGVVGQELSQPLAVKVLDANGRAVAGQAVTFRVTAGGGSVFAGTSNTNADGIAQERWTLGTTAGAPQTVEARAVDNDTGQPVVFGTFHATAVPGSAASLAIVTQPASSAQVGAQLSPQPAVDLLDRYGNRVAQHGVSVTASVVPSAGYTLSGTSSVETDNSGLATFSGLSLSGQTGSVTLNFAASGLTSIASSAIVLSAGAAGKLIAQTSTSLSGTVATRLPDSFVEVTDNVGNPVSGVTVTFTGSQGSNVGTASMATNDKGQAGFQWTLPTAVGTYTVTVSSAGLSGSPITFTATATPSTPTRIALVSGSGFRDTVGKPTPPLIVRVTDDYGNALSDATVNWRATTNSGGGVPTLSASSSVTSSDGTTQIGATLQTQTGANTSGSATVIASLANGASVSFTLTAVAGAPAAISKQFGDGQSAQLGATLLPLVVRVSDRYGNPADAKVNFLVTSGGGSVDPTSGMTSAGIVGTSWTLGNIVGTQQVTASTNGLSTVFSATALEFHLAVVQQPPSSAQATFALDPSPSVRLVDASGAPVKRPNVMVTASVPSPFALSGVSPMPTNGDGVATFKLAVSGSTGAASISFSGVGLVSTASSPITVSSQQAMSLKWNGADGGTQRVGSRLVQPITLRVTDGSGNPLPNVIVTFSVIAGGGTISTFDEFLVYSTEMTSAAQTTDANGQAMVRTWTLGPNPGANVVRATVGNASIDFTLNGVP